MITARIQRAEIDENHNIRVYTNYYDTNDQLIQEAFGVYNFFTAENITLLMEKVNADIVQNCQILIKRAYSRNRNNAEVGDVVNRITSVGDIVVDRATITIGRRQIEVNEDGIIPK